MWKSERGVEGVLKTMLRAISTGTAGTISLFDLVSHDHVVPTNSDVSVQQHSEVIGYSASAWDIGDDAGIQISPTREFQAVVNRSASKSGAKLERRAECGATKMVFLCFKY